MSKCKTNQRKIKTFKESISQNSYPGRGIVTGFTKNVDKAVFAYFIMGRSISSRNRIFIYDNQELFTSPLDESKIEDPSLIIYQAVKYMDNKVIITNGDHTLTIAQGFSEGKDLHSSLSTRTFEPDPPNFTSRISAVMDLNLHNPHYTLSILKRKLSPAPSHIKTEEITGNKAEICTGEGSGEDSCNRFFFTYGPTEATGHLIHTYQENACPLPAFTGEPRPITIPQSIDQLTEEIWSALDSDNKISLFVTYIDLKSQEKEYRLINKYSK